MARRLLPDLLRSPSPRRPARPARVSSHERASTAAQAGPDVANWSIGRRAGRRRASSAAADRRLGRDRAGSARSPAGITAPVQSTTVDGRPAAGGTTVEDRGRRRRRAARGSPPRRGPPAGRRRWPTSSAAARRPRRALAARRGPARAGRSSGRRPSARPGNATSGRCGTITVRPPGQNAAARAVGRRRHRPRSAAPARRPRAAA